MLPERTAAHGTRTLQVSLEEVARLGADYLVTDRGVPWAASDLLAHLRRTAPERLTLEVYLRYPSSTQEGAIYRPTPRGGFILLYRIERWKPN